MSGVCQSKTGVLRTESQENATTVFISYGDISVAEAVTVSPSNEPISQHLQILVVFLC